MLVGLRQLRGATLPRQSVAKSSLMPGLKSVRPSGAKAAPFSSPVNVAQRHPTIPLAAPRRLAHDATAMTARLSLLLLALASASLFAADDYKPGPDSLPQAGVPKGELTKDTFTAGKDSVFPGTEREVSLYIPQQLNRSKPAPYMVFQDGVIYQAPIVFDNLIAKKELPPMIGIFIRPGVIPAPSDKALPRFNRSYEYDTVSGSYAQFLVKELIPWLKQKHQLNLSDDPNDHAIAGSSSGGIAAFVAAWFRPDAFRRVFTNVGTYVGLRDGNELPTLVRKTEPKPIRLFLQDGANDQNIYGGNWFIANQDMLSALEWAGYDVNHVWGEGGHNQKHATALFPDALRWLWRDYPQPIKANAAGKSKSKVYETVDPGSEWQVVSEGHGFTEGPAANAQGEVFFTDIGRSRIHKIGLDGTVQIFAEHTGKANGLAFGPDGRLFACADEKQQITAYTPDGKASVVAEGFGSNDICATHEGSLYISDPGGKKIWLVTKTGEKRVVDEGGYTFVNGLRLSPDQSLLYVIDSKARYVYSLTVQPDGGLANKQKYYFLHADDDAISSADGMTLDTDGRLYVCTVLGLQVFDQAGRANCIFPKPQNKHLSNAVFGGKDFSELYITCGDKVYKRKTKVKGVISGVQEPVKPKAPHL